MTIKELRLAKFMTQRELSAASGLTEASISRIETGRHVARLKTLRKLADALGVAPEDLVPAEVHGG